MIQAQIASFSRSVWYWRVAILRCFVYALMTGWGAFNAGTEGLASIYELNQIQRWKLAGNICVTFLGVILSFLDTTIQRLQSSRSDFDTAQLNRMQIPPKQ